MAKKPKKNLLLSSLEEIKKESQEELPQEPTPAPVPVPRKETKAPAGASSLLDSLLDEVKEEARREVDEITKSLEERTAQERAAVEQEERRKKEQYDKLIQDEARRRLQMIKRKEDERRRVEQAERQREEARKEAVLVAAQQKKARKNLKVALGVVGGILATVVVLVVTGVIPLLPEEAPSVSEGAQNEETKPTKATLPPRVKEKEDPNAPVIAEAPAEPATIGIDGQGSIVLDLPERHDISKLAPKEVPQVVAEAVEVERETMSVRLARAFARTSSSSGGSSSSSGSSDGGIKIDDSIFKD